LGRSGEPSPFPESGRSPLRDRGTGCRGHAAVAERRMAELQTNHYEVRMDTLARTVMALHSNSGALYCLGGSDFDGLRVASVLRGAAAS